MATALARNDRHTRSCLFLFGIITPEDVSVVRDHGHGAAASERRVVLKGFSAALCGLRAFMSPL